MVEVRGRVIPKRQDCEGKEHWKDVKSNTGEELYEVEPLDEEGLRHSLKKLCDEGIKAIAVALMHSYIYPAHEERIEAIATEMGFTHVSLSSRVMPMVRKISSISMSILSIVSISYRYASFQEVLLQALIVT